MVKGAGKALHGTISVPAVKYSVKSTILARFVKKNEIHAAELSTK